MLNISFQSVKKPKLEVVINSRSFLALVDTGADVSLLGLKCATEMNLDWKEFPNKIYFAIGGKEDHGQTEIEIQIPAGNMMTKHRFIIVENLRYDVIIGMDLMVRLGMSLSMDKESIYFPNESCFRYSSLYEAIVCQSDVADESDPESLLSHLDEPFKGETLDIIDHNKVDEQEVNEMIQNSIDLHAEKAEFSSTPYRRSPEDNAVIEHKVQELLTKGYIKESNSSISSPVVLFKKGSKIRMCVDYQRLKKMTIHRPYPIPHMEDLYDSIGTARVFSVLDLKSRYHQIKIRETDTFKTAFVTKTGKYEYLRMPFGLVNAPYTFQKLMNEVLKDFLYKFCVFYLDDVLIYSPNEKDHLQHIVAILDQFQESKLRINASKCQFFQPKVKFLGLEMLVSRQSRY